MCARTDITFYFSYRLKGSDNYQQFEKATDLERFDLFFKRLCEVKELGEVKDLKKMLEAVLGTAPTVRTSVLASRSQRADIRQLVQQYFFHEPLRAQLDILLRDPAVFFERFLDKTELFSAVGRDRFMKQKRIPIENSSHTSESGSTVTAVLPAPTGPVGSTHASRTNDERYEEKD